jgi:hypothetical protein
MVLEATRLRFSEFCAAPPVQFIDPVKVDLAVFDHGLRVGNPNGVIDPDWDSRLRQWPAAALAFACVVLPAIIRTSTPRRPAWISASTVLEPVARLYALTRISRSAASIASTAKAAQSSSGEKRTATAARSPRDATGKADRDSPRNCGSVDPAMLQSQQ